MATGQIPENDSEKGVKEEQDVSQKDIKTMVKFKNKTLSIKSVYKPNTFSGLIKIIKIYPEWLSLHPKHTKWLLLS